MITITIDGFVQAMKSPQGVITPPLPKSMRDKFYVKMYSPAEVKKWQHDAKRLAIEQMKGKVPFAGMLEVTIRVYLPVPKSMSKRKQALALAEALRPITRPDCDNYAKSILDSMSGVLFLDDAQIVTLHVGKFYAEKPRVEIAVIELAYPTGTVEVADQPPLFPAVEGDW